MKKIKLALWSIITAVSLTVIIFLLCNYRIEQRTDRLVFDNPELLPANKAGLLLGTAKYLASGQINPYFEFRIQAAVKLYKSGKIKYIVISGDNGHADYNEPQDMKVALMLGGVPEDRIYLDYAGFRTYDSIYRMYAIFGQDSFTVVSQEFHNRRAVYIANALNLHAVGFNAQDVTAYYGLKTQIREKIARVWVMLDILFDKKPRFLGEKIKVGE